jgi:hypothetical protein
MQHDQSTPKFWESRNWDICFVPCGKFASWCAVLGIRIPSNQDFSAGSANSGRIWLRIQAQFKCIKLRRKTISLLLLFSLKIINLNILSLHLQFLFLNLRDIEASGSSLFRGRTRIRSKWTWSPNTGDVPISLSSSFSLNATIVRYNALQQCHWPGQLADDNAEVILYTKN